MDVTMLDVTDVPGAAIGDIATIYGVWGYGVADEQILPASQVARSIGTVTSDLLCAVSQRVPRIYLSART